MNGQRARQIRAMARKIEVDRQDKSIKRRFRDVWMGYIFVREQKINAGKALYRNMKRNYSRNGMLRQEILGKKR